MFLDIRLQIHLTILQIGNPNGSSNLDPDVPAARRRTRPRFVLYTDLTTEVTGPQSDEEAQAGTTVEESIGKWDLSAVYALFQ